MPCQTHPEIESGLATCRRCGREFCANCTLEFRSFHFCAGCKTAQMRDVLAGTDLLSPDYASLDKRFGAWLIDGLIKFIISIAVALVARFVVMGTLRPHNHRPLTEEESFAILAAALGFSIFGFLLGMCYEGWMLAAFDGQSLGKMAVNIRVVTAEGNAISGKQAWGRSALKLLLFCVGCNSCIGVMLDGVFALGEERASLHDLGSRTRVINAE